MELFKFALGPYEFFASIIGGAPLILAIFLIYNPAISFQELSLIIQGNSSIQVVIILSFFSYLLGGLVQGITWRFFLMLCKIFNQDLHYFKNHMILERSQALQEKGDDLDPKMLEFEDRLVLLLREKVGIPKNIDWIYSRLHSYLKENNRPSVVTADLYQATHIMYRNISFGLLLVSVVILVNLLRLKVLFFEQLALFLMFITLSYISFLRSSSFKRWYSREVLLGFYFAASSDRSSGE
ncbi:MAG: hypothetical protein SFY66_14015 [Oculatellaceae cyanobacterium bins.114]|nr:hypothetical protein [Oculatellaceae cyanobacterium bins.114]